MKVTSTLTGSTFSPVAPRKRILENILSNQTRRFSRTGPIAFAALLCSTSFIALADNSRAPVIDAAQYAGGNQVGLRWFDADDLDDTVCGINAYGLFGRSNGGEYELKADLRSTTDRFWFGPVEGLSETTPVELQIRRKVGASQPGEYCETPDSNSIMVDTTSIDNPPTFDAMGDIRLTDAQTGFGSTSRLNIRIRNWMSNISDQDGNTQVITEFDNYSVGSIYANYWYDFDRIEPVLQDRDVRLGSRQHPYLPDGLSVAQLCNISSDGGHDFNEWVGTCSEQYPFVISMDPATPGAEFYPSFALPDRLNIGADYSAKVFESWATNVSAGVGASASSFLYFHTLWVTNSSLFEEAPYLSSPSGSLRFKFKDGVAGTSRVYFALGDWDAYSLENNSGTATPRFRFPGFAGYAGNGGRYALPSDHSAIHYVDITVGDATAPAQTSPGATGLDLQLTPRLNNSDGETQSGGGALGVGLLMVTAIAARTRRRIKQARMGLSR